MTARPSSRARPTPVILVLGLLAGCAGPATVRSPVGLDRDATPGAAACVAFFERLDGAIETTGVRDVEAARVPGFPYLRVSRFLASFRDEVGEPARFDAWTAAMRRLADDGYAVELRNLPEARLPAVLPGADRSAVAGRLKACADTLAAHDRRQPGFRAAVTRRAVRPPAYSTLKRTLGLYPLSARAVLGGVRELHAERQPVFARPPSKLPTEGERLIYAPPAAEPAPAPAAIARILRESAGNPLAIPRPTGPERDRLFEAFAPVWRIDTVTDSDRIGAPRWGGSKSPVVDTTRPRVYRRLARTRFEGRVLLQLVYAVWFPARPKEGPFDPLGGHLDGITWRVTLAPDGRVLLYDSMHNCGCYHMFFPGPALHQRPPREALAEPPWVPQPAPILARGERVHVYVASRSHYLQGVIAGPPTQDTRRYGFAEAHALRSLAAPAGGPGARRSLFAADGIVRGTHRLERLLLWPTGVASPGAMRQWGTHATAFVGRRHFDDPDLIGRYFEWAPSSSATRASSSAMRFRASSR